MCDHATELIPNLYTIETVEEMRADPLYDPSERPQSLLTKWLDGIKGAIAAVSDWLENPWVKIGIKIWSEAANAATLGTHS